MSYTQQEILESFVDHTTAEHNHVLELSTAGHGWSVSGGYRDRKEYFRVYNALRRAKKSGNNRPVKMPLSNEQVRAIQEARASGETLASIAAKFGCSVNTVYRSLMKKVYE